jgi:hypothetical protein
LRRLRQLFKPVRRVLKSASTFLIKKNKSFSVAAMLPPAMLLTERSEIAKKKVLAHRLGSVGGHGCKKKNN